VHLDSLPEVAVSAAKLRCYDRVIDCALTCKVTAGVSSKLTLRAAVHETACFVHRFVSEWPFKCLSVQTQTRVTVTREQQCAAATAQAWWQLTASLHPGGLMEAQQPTK
jgi:hypothetical protein